MGAVIAEFGMDFLTKFTIPYIDHHDSVVFDVGRSITHLARSFSRRMPSTERICI